MHQKSQGPLQSRALIWTRTHSSLHFFICSGIAVSPWGHIDLPFSHFLHFPTIAWLTGTLFYNFADLWYQWHPPFTECKAEWISSEKKMKQWWSGPLQGGSQHLWLCELLDKKYTSQNIKQRHLKMCTNNIHISPEDIWKLMPKMYNQNTYRLFDLIVEYLLQNYAY